MSDRYRKLPTHLLLQRVAAARARGDWREAQGEWEACIARARERVVNVVGRHYSGEDAEAVVQEALLRGATKLVENLESLTEGSFYAGMVQAAKYQCLDSGRRHIVRDKQRAGSLDEPAGWTDDADGPGRYDKQLAREATERADRDAAIADAGRLLDALLPTLKDQRAQKLLALQRLGVTDAEIATELEISTDYVHTIRSRAFKELRGLHSS